MVGWNRIYLISNIQEDPTLFNIFLESIVCEALNDREGSVSIGGRLTTSFRFADNSVVIAEEEKEAGVLVDRLDRTTSYKVQNGDWCDDKQPKRLPKRDHDKRSEARSSEELQVPWRSHL